MKSKLVGPIGAIFHLNTVDCMSQTGVDLIYADMQGIEAAQTINKQIEGMATSAQ
jgi:hypothetical protein